MVFPSLRLENTVAAISTPLRSLPAILRIVRVKDVLLLHLHPFREAHEDRLAVNPVPEPCLRLGAVPGVWFPAIHTQGTMVGE